jgi:uncharacterized membrane protein YqiK
VGATAQANRIQSLGIAEAEAIQKKGEAGAEVMRQKAEAFKQVCMRFRILARPSNASSWLLGALTKTAEPRQLKSPGGR